ncbi:hypothetical protein HCG51_35340 (plasmid) [Tolypothrix sp. PCC 7910]|uniref:hypothetical protein n=1 Tax=Tolypothrix sp. PCC 7910 TaxID=2099387 RepID=UPI0014278210|nr:hypothetical protein [Tolypothrix sp. PCC 7910]QIR41951.1 hypothetical protein HCG51_35340 [Tolypothrix sp. PCC 7910]
MNKPLGYYCAVTPGDGSYLDWLQDTYGSQLEGIPRLEKLHLLQAITVNLLNAQIATEGRYIKEIRRRQHSKIASMTFINIYP